MSMIKRRSRKKAFGPASEGALSPLGPSLHTGPASRLHASSPRQRSANRRLSLRCCVSTRQLGPPLALPPPPAAVPALPTSPLGAVPRRAARIVPPAAADASSAWPGFTCELESECELSVSELDDWSELPALPAAFRSGRDGLIDWSAMGSSSESEPASLSRSSDVSRPRRCAWTWSAGSNDVSTSSASETAVSNSRACAAEVGCVALGPAAAPAARREFKPHRRLPAAWVDSAAVAALEGGRLRVVTAVVQLGEREGLSALGAVEEVGERPDAPEKFAGGVGLALAALRNPSRYAPPLVRNVLGDGVAVKVDEHRRLEARLPVALLVGEVLVAVGAPAQLLLLIGQHLVDLLLVQPRRQSVLLVAHPLYLLRLEPLGQLGQQLVVEAAQVERQPHHLGRVLLEEAKTHLHQLAHPQKVGRDQDAHHSRRVELRRRSRLVDVLHQPLEDVHVAMHRNVDVFVPPGTRQVGLEIEHVGQQQLARAVKVAADPPLVVAYVNRDQVVPSALGRGSNARPSARPGPGTSARPNAARHHFVGRAAARGWAGGRCTGRAAVAHPGCGRRQGRAVAPLCRVLCTGALGRIAAQAALLPFSCGCLEHGEPFAARGSCEGERRNRRGRLHTRAPGRTTES
eukprot:scaffold33388_cov122-Isochrysis_galbana.AAC.2